MDKQDLRTDAAQPSLGVARPSIWIGSLFLVSRQRHWPFTLPIERRGDELIITDNGTAGVLNWIKVGCIVALSAAIAAGIGAWKHGGGAPRDFLATMVVVTVVVLWVPVAGVLVEKYFPRKIAFHRDGTVRAFRTSLGRRRSPGWMRGSWAAVISRIKLGERTGLRRLHWNGYGLVVWGMKDVAVLATADDPRELEALRDEIAAWCGMEPVLREGRELRIGCGT